jgi:TolB-like protein
MKKNTTVIVLAFFGLLASLSAYAAPQIAVLDTVLAAGVDPAAGILVTNKIEEEFVNQKKYHVLDRANIDRVLREKEFQLSSGVVRNEEVRQAGEYLGADFVVVANVSRIGQTYVISAKMIDISSGEIAAQASAQQAGRIDVLLDVAKEVGVRLAGTAVTVAGIQEEPVEEKAEPAAEKPKAEKPAAIEASGTASGSAAVMQLQALIRAKAHMRSAGQLQMMSLADQISDSERMFLYSSNMKNNAGMALLLNWLVPSLGSFIQGDVVGGITELGLLAAGAVCLGVGWTDYYDSWGFYLYSEPNFLYYTGIGVLVVYVVYYCVRPFSYQRTWNRNLAKSLKTVSLSVLDADGATFAVYPTDRGPEWKLGLSLVSFKY